MNVCKRVERSGGGGKKEARSGPEVEEKEGGKERRKKGRGFEKNELQLIVIEC